MRRRRRRDVGGENGGVCRGGVANRCVGGSDEGVITQIHRCAGTAGTKAAPDHHQVGRNRKRTPHLRPFFYVRRTIQHTTSPLSAS